MDIINIFYSQHLNRLGFCNPQTTNNANLNKIIIQKRSKFEQNELAKINAAFERQGIKYVVIKGWTLYYDLYGKDNTHISSDIDILVAKNDLFHAAKVLESIGYTYNNKPLTHETLKKDWHLIMGMQHIEPMTRPIDDPFIKISTVELHHSIAPTYVCDFGNGCDKYELDTSEMIDRRKLYVYNKQSIYRLNPTDEFKMLILHYCAHIFISYRRMIRVGSDVNLYFDLLFDIAKYWQKYNKFIDIKLLYNELTNKHRVLCLLIVAKFICEIFGVYILNSNFITSYSEDYTIGQDVFRRVANVLLRNNLRSLIINSKNIIKSEIRRILICDPINSNQHNEWYVDIQVLTGFKYTQRVCRTLQNVINMQHNNNCLILRFNINYITNTINFLKAKQNSNQPSDIGKPGLFIAINRCLDSSSDILQLYNIYIDGDIMYIDLLQSNNFIRYSSEQLNANTGSVEFTIKVDNICSPSKQNDIILDVYASLSAPYYHLCISQFCRKFIV